MNIFVIGGTGYIGSAAVRALVEHHTVKVLARSDEAEQRVKSMRADVIRGDLGEPLSYQGVLDEVDAVVFAASGQGEDWGKVDKTATEAIVAALRGTNKPLIRVLGSMVYGDTGEQPKAEDAPLNPPPFLEPAATTEQKLLDDSGVRVAYVHAALVYGQGGGDVPKILLKAARDEGAGLYISDGNNAWDTIHVNDVGRLIAQVVTGPDTQGRYLASSIPLTTKELAEAVARELDLGEVKSVTGDEAETHFDFFATPLTLNQRFKTARSKALGWAPRGPKFADTLKEY